MATGQDFGLNVPTTNVWDTSQIQSLEGESAQLKELLIRLYQNLNRVSIAINLKESAIYGLQEFVTGGSWQQMSSSVDSSQTSVYRPERRKVLNAGALANAGTITIPHGITCTPSTSITYLQAFATNPVSTFGYIPIPYASTTAVADNIELYMDGTNVYIKTAANYSAYTICYVIIQFLQN